MTENAKGLVDIGKFVLTFAKVQRMTLHEDGIQTESDADHTVMLSVCACALAQKLYPDLDIGKVAQFAIAHDLVEAYALDTDSFGLTAEGKKAKEERERAALARIREEFGAVYPWIPETVEAYEELNTKEARFVKILDKIMPKITHIMNKAIVFKRRDEALDTMMNHFNKQHETFEREYGRDMPELTAIFRELADEVLRLRTHE